LRLPYQLQLGAIFAWGFYMGGGTFGSFGEIARFVAVFALFHVGAFGGMTALNSFYDRDEGPVGGMWSPPKVPPYLWHFAWLIQVGGLFLLLPLGWRLMLVYTVLLALSLLYSHPIPRGKGHPWKSLAIVVVGQGVLDCLAGALTAQHPRWDAPFWCGLAGATSMVAAFYPLTQLYQVNDDLRRGDRTLAAWLIKRGGRRLLFAWAALGSAFGTLCNAVALWHSGLPIDAACLLLAGALPLLFIAQWQRSDPEVKTDFRRVHFLMRWMALAFGGYVLLRLGAAQF
jgi:1,4-dihydroxy-2-naphthoate octaprenyltransferase